MDGSRFDNLTRALTRARSRRSLVRVLGGAVAGLIGRGEAAAHPRCNRDGEKCQFPTQCCSHDCVTWDGVRAGNRCPRDRNCYCRGNGGWGTECDDAGHCEKRYGKDESWKCDTGWCVFKCGTAQCRPDQACRDRGDGLRCWKRCNNDGDKCWFTRSWDPDGVCSRGICYPKPWIGGWCHDYGPDCPGGSVCTAQPGGAGTCRCRPGQTVCGKGYDAYCSDLNSDKANCGACGAKCPNDPNIRCSSGKCVCPANQTLCGTGDAARCRDLQTDPFNCGRCSRPCLTQLQRCKNGNCCNRDGVACPDGCGPGGPCGRCCSGICDLDGACGPIPEEERLDTGATCPSGCSPQKRCPGCRDGTCNRDGFCSPDGCVFYGKPCEETAQCCDTDIGVFCNGGLCRFN